MKKELKAIDIEQNKSTIKLLKKSKYIDLITIIIIFIKLINDIFNNNIILWLDLLFFVAMISLIMNLKRIIKNLKRVKKDTNNYNKALKFGKEIKTKLTSIKKDENNLEESNYIIVYKKDEIEYLLKYDIGYELIEHFLKEKHDTNFVLYEYNNEYYINQKEVFDKICKKLSSKGFNNNPIKGIKLKK